MSQSGSLNRGGSNPDDGDVLAFTGGAGTAGSFPVLPTGAGDVEVSSNGGTIQITGGANSLNFEATGSVLNVTSLTGDSGGPVPPTGNNINTFGNGSITSVGNPGTSTITYELQGLTNHAVLVGAGTTTITKLAIGATNQVLLGNTGADPSWGTVPNSALTNSSVTINGGNNITVTGGSPLALGGTASVAVTGTTNHLIQLGNASGSLSSLVNGTTGQVLQAVTSNDPAWSTATYPSVATTSGTILRANGTNWLATTAQYPNTTTINQVLYSSSNNFITGITASNNGVLISGTTGVPSWLADGTTGQVLTATAGSPPSWASPTVPPTAVISLTGNTGGAVSPTTNNINTIGTGSILIAGNPGTSTLVTQLTGLTNHAVLVGMGTATISNVGPTSTAGQVLQSAGAAADPAFSTATYPSVATGTGTILRADGTNWVATTATYPTTTTINQILYSSSANVVSGLATGNDGVLITSNTGVPSFLANGTTGQVLTATTGSPPSWATPGAATDLHTARYIVSAGGITDGANYTTIATAYAAAVAATGVQTVFVQPGSYTENLTLSPNVNISAYVCDATTPTVTIIGKMTMTAAGTCSISGVNLQTNSNYVIESTGSNALTLVLTNCNINATNNSAIHCTNASATIRMVQCRGDLGTTGITFSVQTGGSLNFQHCNLLNSGASTTASTCSAGSINFSYSQIRHLISLSGSGGIGCSFTNFLTGGLGTTPITIGGSGTNVIEYCEIDGGTASALSISITALIIACRIDSNNTNAITGSGSITYGGLIFTGTSSLINTTTQTPYAKSNDAVVIKAPGSYPYTTVPQDNVIIVDTTSARTIVPLASPATGQRHVIKDNTGSALANNITVTPSGKNIDGASSKTIITNYGSMTIVYNGTQWNVIG